MRAGIEAGGTKFVCAVGTGPHDVVARTVVPTTTPDETLARVCAWLAAQQRADRPIEAVGLASFGPLDLDTSSASYGFITTTPKPGWGGTDLVGAIRQRFDVPVGLDTDVNGAACAEHRWGAGRGLPSLVYLTVGTGVGGGAVLAGRPLTGPAHPEMGHLHVQRHPADDLAGTCPFHADCVEGLASGPAVAARAGHDGPTLARDPRLRAELGRAVEIEAWYLAQLVSAVLYVLSPARIVLGGGVLGLPGLLDAVRRDTVRRLGGALAAEAVTDGISGYLVPPELGGSAGVLGALDLAERALRSPGGRRVG